MRPIGGADGCVCWHCGRTVDLQMRTTRYLYRGELPSTAVIEDWVPCDCGAFQNVRRVNEIIISPLRAS